MNLARSPYIIEIAETGQEGSKVELFLGSDIGTSNPTYTLSKLIPASNKIETYYNISPYIREYFNFTHWQNATGLELVASMGIGAYAGHILGQYLRGDFDYNEDIFWGETY